MICCDLITFEQNMANPGIRTARQPILSPVILRKLIPRPWLGSRSFKAFVPKMACWMRHRMRPLYDGENRSQELHRISIFQPADILWISVNFRLWVGRIMSLYLCKSLQPETLSIRRYQKYRRLRWEWWECVEIADDCRERICHPCSRNWRLSPPSVDSNDSRCIKCMYNHVHASLCTVYRCVMIYII